MFFVSLLVIAPVIYVLTERSVPGSMLSRLNTWLPDDVAPSSRLIAFGVIGGLAVGFTPLNRPLRYLCTVVHELGHAFTVGILGGRPKKVTIALDASGLATFEYPGTWGRFRISVVSIAGYPAPAIAALAAIMATQSGHPQAWFAFSTATLSVAVLLLIRNFWGFAWTAVLIAGSYLLARHAPVAAIGTAVAAIGGFLAVQSVSHAHNQFTIVRRNPSTFCDAVKIAELWRMNSKFVAFVQLFSVTGIATFAIYMGVQPYIETILRS